MNTTFKTAVQNNLLHLVEDGLIRATFSDSLKRYSIGDLVILSSLRNELLFDLMVKRAEQLGTKYIYAKVPTTDVNENEFLKQFGFTKESTANGYNTWKLYAPFKKEVTANVSFKANPIERLPCNNNQKTN